MPDEILVIACGALARELTELKRTYGWQHLRLKCLDARLHNTPDAIPAAVREAIRDYGANFRHVFVAYADCGTGGALDRVLEAEGIQRLPGAHCDAYFGNYTRLVYLSQSLDATLAESARDAAGRLGLAFEHIHCGLDELESAMTERVLRWGGDQEDFRLLA